jgi:hypothetical protein
MANVSSNNLTTLYSGSGVNIRPTSAYGNANVVALLNAGTDGANTVQNIVATGNVTANSFIGNFVGLGNIATINLDGNISNVLNGDGVFRQPSGNISANFALYAGNVTVNAQPNITSLGTLTSLTVSGNVSAPTVYSQGMVTQGYDFVQMQYSNGVALPVSPYDIGTGSWFYLDAGGAVWQSNTTGTLQTVTMDNNGNVSASGNISANYYIGDGSQLTGIVATSGNANYANFAGEAFNVNVANVTGLGNIATVNLDGNSGNILFGNGIFAAVPNVANVANANYANFAGTAFSVAGANVSGIVANANYSAYANIAATANSVAVANVSGIGNIATINLDGNVSNLLTGLGTFVAIPTVSANANYANFAGTVITNAQPNITSTGNLVSLNINNGVAGSTTKQFDPNGISIGSTANINLMANSSFVDIDYGNGQGGGNVLLGKSQTYLKARGNSSSITTANVSDRVGRTNYMFYNGNANVLAAATQVTPFAVFNANANAITTAGQFQIITGNPNGDQGNANALSNQNVISADPYGRLTIQQGAAGTTSVAMNINTYGGSGGNAASATQNILFFRSRGNRDSNLSVQPNDQLGGILFSGYNGTAQFATRTATIRAVVDNSYVANNANISAGLQFITCDNTTNYTTTFSASGAASFPGSISTANGVTVVMNNISTVNPSFGFSTYNNANSLVNPYTFFRARGNSATPAAAQVGDAVSVVGYNIYADAGNTYTSVASTSVVVSENDGAGNVASTYNVTAKTITLTGNVSGNSFTTTGILSANGNSTIANLQLNRFQENVFAYGNATGTITPDFVNGSIQNLTLTGNITMNTLSNAISGRSMTLILTQDATGNRTLTSSMLFAGANKTLSTAASAKDIISVFYDGTNYFATLSKGYA